MINYTEKGAGLHLAISKAGYVLRQENNVFVSNDDTVVQAIIDAYTLANAQDYAADQVNKITEIKFNKAIKGTSAAEMAGWPILRAEQIKYEASGLIADCPSIVVEAAIRGVSVQALADRIKANAAEFDWLRAAIAGVSGKHRDAMKQITTFEGIASYDYSTGWPL